MTNLNPNKLLTEIIIYDQLYRHICRVIKINYNTDYINLSISLTKLGLLKNYDNYYTPQQRCFFLLPYRHSNNSRYINISKKYGS